MDEETNAMELGGNIHLVGFSGLATPELLIVKKIVGGYARKLSDDLGEKFEKLSVTLKIVHPREKSEKHELHVKVLVKGRPCVAEIVDRNLFVGLDAVLKKALTEVEKAIDR